MYTEKRNLLALASPDASDSESIQRALIVFSEWMGPAALNTRYKTPIIIIISSSRRRRPPPKPLEMDFRCCFA